MVSIRLFAPAFTGLAGCALSGATDNQGNSFVVAKLATQKFPLCTLTLQLAEMLEDKGLFLHLYWRRRDLNEEADSLTNDDEPTFPGFGFRARHRVDWAFRRHEWPVLERYLALGAEFFGDLEKAKAKRTAGGRTALAESCFPKVGWAGSRESSGGLGSL